MHRHAQTNSENCCRAKETSPAAEVVENAVERLRRHGLRVTEPRKAMLRELAGANGPVSVEQLHASVGAGAVDLVTIYRSIEAFERIGIVQRHPLESGKNLYELASRNHRHHHHVICRNCGRIDPLDECAVEHFEAAATKRGYTQLTHVFEIYGLCRDCGRT